jgi:hypothetical protein
MLGEFWCTSARRGFHPKDEPHILPEYVIDWTPKKALASREVFSADRSLHSKIHRNLFPHPFMGNIRSAKVFILFGNPGLKVEDYDDENNNEHYVRLCTETLAGSSSTVMCLDPGVQDTGGGHYWRKRFKRLAKDICQERGLTVENAYQLITQRVAVLEGVAYHSKISPGGWAWDLPSSKIIKEYVQQELLPRAANGEIRIFVWRGAAFWNVVPRPPQVIVRSPKQAHLRNLFSAERSLIRQMILSV